MHPCRFNPNRAVVDETLRGSQGGVGTIAPIDPHLHPGRNIPTHGAHVGGSEAGRAGRRRAKAQVAAADQRRHIRDAAPLEEESSPILHA